MYHRKYRHVERIMMQIFRNLQKIGMRSEHFHRRQSRLNANAIELLSLPPSLKAYQYIRKPAINTVPAIHFRLSTKNFRFLKSRYTKPIPIMINKRVEYPIDLKNKGLSRAVHCIHQFERLLCLTYTYSID